MSEENTQIQKPKTTKFAIVSFLIPLIGCIGSFGFIATLLNRSLENYQVFMLVFVFPALHLTPIIWVLAIWAIVKIKRSRGTLKGYTLSILSILLSLLYLDIALSGIASTRPEGVIKHYQSELVKIGKAMQEYSTNYNNRYPTADKWCDLLIADSNLDKGRFFSGGTMSKSNSYAMNPNAEPNSSKDMVLLFEANEGWNLYGGPELMVFDSHYREGSNVLFNDGHVEFIRPKKAKNLKWNE